MKTKLEYLWLDGCKPTQGLRSKTRVATDFGGTLEDCPMWAFDGSSTEQAEGNASDCLLLPVALFPDPDRQNACGPGGFLNAALPRLKGLLFQLAEKVEFSFQLPGVGILGHAIGVVKISSLAPDR